MGGIWSVGATPKPVCGGGADSPEQIAWAVQDMERLLLPVLDRLHTAQDLWDWVSQPGNLLREPSFPGFSDLDRLREWSLSFYFHFDKTSIIQGQLVIDRTTSGVFSMANNPIAKSSSSASRQEKTLL